MKKVNARLLFTGAGLLAAFLLWTLLLGIVDRQAIGPCGTVVGFATLNGYVHRLTGVHMSLYTVTDWLGLVPIGVAFGFAVLGLVQWIKRKSLGKVDRRILALGGFYLAVMAVYLLFEAVIINYRPILIMGHLEASYPSSTTMLVMCVMPSAAVELNARIKRSLFRKCLSLPVWVFIVFMVTGRLVSGVHWVTDIIGGTLFSAGLVMFFYAFEIERTVPRAKNHL